MDLAIPTGLKPVGLSNSKNTKTVNGLNDPSLRLFRYFLRYEKLGNEKTVAPPTNDFKRVMKN